MIFGKHINRYYLKYAFWLIAGLAALVLVDFLQLEIPKLYRMVIDGMAYGYIIENVSLSKIIYNLYKTQGCARIRAASSQLIFIYHRGGLSETTATEAAAHNDWTSSASAIVYGVVLLASAFYPCPAVCADEGVFVG